jgi:hypothetical protein
MERAVGFCRSCLLVTALSSTYPDHSSNTPVTTLGFRGLYRKARYEPFQALIGQALVVAVKVNDFSKQSVRAPLAAAPGGSRGTRTMLRAGRYRPSPQRDGVSLS